jgi:polysaccharide export outer membrane protein
MNLGFDILDTLKSRWLALCLCLFAALAQAQPQPAAAREDYLLGEGDVIKVTVYQSPELSLELRIPASGSVSYPLLGDVTLGGLTVNQAERRLAEGLIEGRILKQPQVSILVTQVRGSQASVLGHVIKPGRYPLELTRTRLSDLMALAGGIASDGGDVLTVTGTREDRPFRVQIDYRQLFATDDPRTNLVIQSNDVVFVDRAPQVYIYGEVQRPGALRLERGMTVLQALAAGGGLTLRGTQSGIRVHRRDAQGVTVELVPGLQGLLQQGDVVFVRESLF